MKKEIEILKAAKTKEERKAIDFFEFDLRCEESLKPSEEEINIRNEKILNFIKSL